MMTRILAALAMMTALTSCGADGEPIQPTANLGVNIGSSGIHPSGSVGMRKGRVAVNVGLF